METATTTWTAAGFRAGNAAAPGRASGVTLVELMVVVIIIATLAVIAMPSYRQFTVRAQRTEAKSALLRIATNQERFYLQNNSYGTIAQLAVAGFPTTSENNTYTLTLATTNGWQRDYTATATPTAGGGATGIDMTTDADCATFTITSEGLRGAAPDPNQNCW